MGIRATLHGFRARPAWISKGIDTRIVRKRYQSTAPGFTSGPLDPIARFLMSVPETVGLTSFVPYPYTVSIVLMTILLRGGISVPMTLWQRKRTERLSQVVVPEWNVWKKQIPALILRREAPKGMPPTPQQQSQIQRQIHRALSEKWKHLVSVHNCSPWWTTGMSLLVNIPLFVLVTMALRHAALMPDSPLVNELLAWWSPDATLAAQVAVSKQLLIEKGMDPGSIQQLTTIGGPTLSGRDTTQIMPIVVGSLNMMNVELSQWTRLRRVQNEEALGFANQSEQSSDVIDQHTEPLRERIIGNVLRAGAVVSIPIASSVPSVLLVYWTTSALVTMAQNSYFAWLETRK
ncbi:hypothetical protein MYAM1_003932 [Malassezia yamatoensis]|uniref:Mitochondrial inner membrane protein COX18 n=1 Tax=Malassezia yamatoensis TaxID=253288 RepID=A0AAJ6CJF1_9BASI|nr:hypothetical protein MYAM1_003932 [Malassezia yamatoensis]